VELIFITGWKEEKREQLQWIRLAEKNTLRFDVMKVSMYHVDEYWSCSGLGNSNYTEEI